MLLLMDGLSPLKTIGVLIFHLLLTYSCRGQSQLIGPSQPIVATVGNDIILPCHLQPAVDVSAKTLDWTRPDLYPRFVFVWRASQDLVDRKNPNYKGRTSLSIDELKHGNISLKLSKVKTSDEGKYRCFIPDMNKESFVELVVASDTVSSPVISIAGIDRDREGVVLQCESKGWYLQPEVIWLDGEGNLLSAEPTETIRGTDHLYTVSSRVTVEKRHSNNFTCRVRQNNINQTRETHFIVPDDIFNIQPSTSPVIIGVSAGLVVGIVLIVAVVFFVWKWKQNKTKDQGNKKLSNSGDPEMQPLNAAGTDGKTQTVTQAASEEIKQTQDVNKQKDTNLAGKNSTELRVYVEIDPDGKYLCLNESREDLKLEDWKLRVKVNDQNPIMFTFKESFTLKANRSVTIWAHGCDPYYPGPSELAWNELKRWAKGDKLFVELINCHEEIVKTTEAQGTSTHRDTNLAGENSTEVRVNVEIDPDGKYLCLNETREEVLLEGWRLRVKVNDEDPIMFTFKESFTIKANRSVTIWAHGCDPYYPGPSELAWNELKRWAREDKLFVELINCHEEIVKTTEAQGTSKCKDNNVAGKNSTEVRVNVEIDPDGKYLYLNESREDLLLEDWRLRVKVNNENPIMFTFKESFTLRANRSVTIWAHGCDPYYPGPSELAWNELKCWAKGDKLFVELINCHEEIITTTETQGRSKQKDTNLAGKNSTELQVNVEIDPDGKYLCLNESKEDLKLEGWKLRVKLNHENPIMYTFDKTVILRAEKFVNMWAFGWGTYSPPSDLIWKDLQRWDKGDKLFVELINCHEEIVKTTEV